MESLNDHLTAAGVVLMSRLMGVPDSLKQDFVRQIDECLAICANSASATVTNKRKITTITRKLNDVKHAILRSDADDLEKSFRSMHFSRTATPCSARSHTSRTPLRTASACRTPVRGTPSTPNQLLKTPAKSPFRQPATNVVRMLDFADAEDALDRAVVNKNMILHDKAEKARIEREARAEAAKKKRLLIEQQRLERLGATPVKSKERVIMPVALAPDVNRKQNAATRTQSPRVPIKKLKGNSSAIVTIPTTAERKSPKRKTRRDESDSLQTSPVRIKKTSKKITKAKKPPSSITQDVLATSFSKSLNFESDSPRSSLESKENVPKIYQPISSGATSTVSHSTILGERTQNISPIVEMKRPIEIAPEKIAAVEPVPTENYGIDDLDSGDETDDEQRPRKAIPHWATVSRMPFELARTVNAQSKLNYDFANYFGPIADVNLDVIFGKEKRYKPRTSSAVWYSPLHRPRPGFSTLDASQVIECSDEEC